MSSAVLLATFVSGRAGWLKVLLDSRNGLMEGVFKYGEAIGAAASLAMAVIWLIYLQLFFRDYRSRRRPRLLIQQADGPQPRQYCSLVNMSDMHMDILGILVAAETKDGEKVRPLRMAEHQVEQFPDQREREQPGNIKDGPLAPGQSLLLSTFQELVNWTTTDESGNKEPPRSLEVRVIFFHGMWDQPNGSSHAFELEHANGELQLVKPATLHTIHLTTRRHRRRIEGWYNPVRERRDCAVGAYHTSGSHRFCSTQCPRT